MSIAGSCGFFAPVYLLSWVHFSQRTAPLPPPHTNCTSLLPTIHFFLRVDLKLFSRSWNFSLFSTLCGNQERQRLPGQPSWIKLFSNLSVVQRGEVTPPGQLSGIKLYGNYPVRGPEVHTCSLYLLLLCCSLFRARWGKTHSFLGCFGWVFLLVFISP